MTEQIHDNEMIYNKEWVRRLNNFCEEVKSKMHPAESFEDFLCKVKIRYTVGYPEVFKKIYWGKE